MNNKFIVNIKPIDAKIEKLITNLIDLKPPNSYDKMNIEELDKINNEIINNFPSNKTINFSKQIILSIRANLMREHMINTYKKIIKQKYKIIKEYNEGTKLINLVLKYDGSPLNLLRLIFQSKYNMKLTKIIKNKNILDSRDLEELDWAINHDAYALINHDEILKNSNEFEKKIKLILDKIKIKYKTQNELIKEQISKINIPINTPDFLIQTDFYINNIKINWIDAKNFYGSNTKFLKKKIINQTKKYIDKWGYGVIIFNLSFNSDLNFDNILLIDYESFTLLNV